MIKKIGYKLFLINLIALILVYFILLENPCYINLFDSILGNNRFYSLFDRIKFVLPIILLLSMTTDYISDLLGKKASIAVVRFNNRKKLVFNTIKGLYLLVLIYWLNLILLGIVVSTYFHKDIKDIFNENLIIIFVSGYFLYCTVVMMQILLLMFLDTNKTFVIIIAITIMSTLFKNNIFRYILILPIGMGIINTESVFGIIRTILIVLINVITNIIIYKRIERLDIGL